jgi:hypothetical protein
VGKRSGSPQRQRAAIVKVLIPNLAVEKAVATLPPATIDEIDEPASDVDSSAAIHDSTI